MKALYHTRSKTGGWSRKPVEICYVSGIEKKEGSSYWSIADNMGIEEINKSKLFSFFEKKKTFRLVSYCTIDWLLRLNQNKLRLSLFQEEITESLVARALLADADIIILDDPTKGVDAGTKQQMYTLFKEAAEQGKLVIWYSTDDVELELCNRVLVHRLAKL